MCAVKQSRSKAIRKFVENAKTENSICEVSFVKIL